MPDPTILVICPHPEDRAPGQRLKYEQYFDSWRAAGFTVDVRPFWSERTWDVLYRRGAWARKVLGVLDGFRRRVRDLRDAKRADLVYLFLEAAPLGPPIIERRIRAAGVPVIYDIDDLVYLPHGSAANGFMRRLRARDKVPELITAADHVIVCTPYLEAYAHQHNEHVTDISSTIDTAAYIPRPHRDRTTGVILGWSGSHSTAPYVHLLDDVLRELQDSDGIELRVIGTDDLDIEGVRLRATSWQRETEVADLSEIDIGLYPLPDEEWVLGKSGLKALQYMALEIPPVAQRVGTNPTIIEHGVNGFLASTPEEWVEAIRTLVRDPALRREMGRAARATVEAHYSVAATEPVYLDVIRQVTQRARRPA